MLCIPSREKQKRTHPRQKHPGEFAFVLLGGERGNKIRVFPMNQGVLQKITPPCKAIEKTSFFDHFQSNPSFPKSAQFSFLHLQRVKIV